MYILILIAVVIIGLVIWISPDIDEVVGYWESWEHEPQEEKAEE